MRKIQTEQERERKKKRNNLLLGIFILVILIGSTLGYAIIYAGGFSDTPSQNTQNPENLGYWSGEYNGQTVYFLNSPENIGNISVETDKAISDYSGKIVYVDSENPTIINYLSSTLGLFTQKIQEACLGSCERNIPEKTCEENMIIWKDSGENKVYQEKNCVFIEGDLTTVDAFLLKIFGFTQSS